MPLHPNTSTWVSGLVDVTTKHIDGTGGYVWCLNEMAEALTPHGLQDDRVGVYTSQTHETYQDAMQAGINYCYAQRIDLVTAASREAQEAERYRRP